ncbi:MAG: hypothetical protein K2Y56_00715 [Methylobacterium sp.]|uniref:hypothetical protein n=1 Tax=Methylobacterium sp. TaxID=409 RepID=UPI0025E11637|nr:hypothetical protein [Methylobacterium sp.]MBX9930059.1 hypothetical protein [Methylobacterium sp.]
MLNADPLLTRPTLTNAAVINTALGELAAQARSTGDIWRLLTDRYVVDLDAAAMVLPSDQPEPVWLSPRS